MTKKHFIYSLLLLTVIGFIGCSSSEVAESKDVNQEKIHQSYNVVFDAEHEDIYAEAVFRFGGSKGTTLTLSEPAKLSLNGNTLQGRQRMLRGFVYSQDQFDNDVFDFEFRYQDIDQKEYINSISVLPISDIQVPDSFSKSNNNLVKWTGPAISQFEKIVVEIIDNAGNMATISSELKGSNEVNILKEKIALLESGTGNLQIYRKINKGLDQQNEMGGEIESTYYSKKTKITITE